MPFVHIRSLPFDPPMAVEQVVADLSRDFAEAGLAALEHITVTWTFFGPGQYAVAGTTARMQTGAGHPLLVELLTPDFHSQARVETMLRAVAASLSARAGVPLNRIFIHHSQARSGHVFDDGEVVRW